MYDFLLVSYYNYLVAFSSYFALNNIVNLKSGLEFTQVSRSLKLVSFASLGAVFYSPSIVAMTLSCIVCEIQELIDRKLRNFIPHLYLVNPPECCEDV